MFHNFIAIMWSPLGSSRKRHSINLICPCITLRFMAIIWHLKELRGTISFRSSDEGTCRRVEGSERVLGKGSSASFQNGTGEGIRFREIYFTLPWGFLLNITRYISSSTLLLKNKPTQGFLYKTVYDMDHSCFIAVGLKDTAQVSPAQSGDSNSSPLLPQLLLTASLPGNPPGSISVVTMMQTSPGIWKPRQNLQSKFTGKARNVLIYGIFKFLHSSKMFAPEKESYDQLRQCIKKQRHHFANKGPCSQSYGFSNSHLWLWELDYKEAECQSIDVFKLWCWRRLLRVPWTTRKSNQSILKEISPEYSLEGLMRKLKLQYSDAKCRFTGKDPDAGNDWR